MFKTIKNTALFIMFSIPGIAIAASCAPGNSQCQLEEKQTKAFEDAGIKPSAITESPTETGKTEEKSTSKTKSFEIPAASYSNMEKDTNTQEQTQKKRIPSFVFTPITTNANDNDKKEQDFVFQPPKNPLQPKEAPQQTGIIYQ